MADFSFWPYEELVVKKLDEPRAFLFSTPWFTSVLNTTSEGEKLIENLFLVERPEDFDASTLISGYRQMFSGIMNQPFSYILPSIPEDFSEFEAIQTGSQKSTAQMLSKEWNWDANATLQISQIPESNFFDPLTVFSVLRRYYYIEASEKDKTKQLFQVPAQKNSANILAYLISQNLHVTQRANKVLSCALPISGKAESLLEKFIEDEAGHDQIMSAALKAFGPNVTDSWATSVNHGTNELMNRFQLASENNFLAFAFIVSLFERPQPTDQHPLTKMLLDAGFDQVAKIYDKHHQINKDGSHDNIGIDLIKMIPPMTESQVIEAVKLSEFVCEALINQSTEVLSTVQEYTTNVQ